MKKLAVIFFLPLFVCSPLSAQPTAAYNVSYFNVGQKIHIRALQVISNTTVWFAANRGIWGYTEDAGKTWYIDSIRVDSIYPQFRSISVLNDSTVLLLGIQSPAYLFKTTNKGKSWRLVYKNTEKAIFFDSMLFTDPKNGVAVSDPINGCPQFIETKDGGEHWTQVVCDAFPKLDTGESFFASSNSNIAVQGKHIWFVTGGKRTRLFYSEDGGKHFKDRPTPFPQGETMTGIYSIAAYNKTTGALAGGHYDKLDSGIVTLALTTDGFKTWKVIKASKPFFGSCVQFRNAGELFVTGQGGTYRYSLKTHKITELTDAMGNSLKYNTLRFPPSGKAVWLAGNNGSIACVQFNK